MKINIMDTLTLDDNNEYVVVSKVKYENKNYYYLSEIKKPQNILFCYEDKDELVELIDGNLIIKLLPLFVGNTKKVITEDEMKTILEKIPKD